MWSLDGTRDQGRRPDPDARPERRRRHAHAVARDRVRARGERRHAAGTDRRAAEERRALPDRRQAAHSSRRRSSGASRTAGWSARATIPSRAPRTRGTTSPTTSPGLAVVQLTRIGWCPKPGLAADGQGDRADRPGGDRPGQAAADRARDRDTDASTFPTARRTAITLSPPNVPWRMEITVAPTFVAEGDRSVEERAPPSSAR